MAFKQFRFLDWNVYKDCQVLFTKILELTKKLPREYRYSFGGQIVRSGLSPILNIAEGSGKATRRNFSRFIDIALGSLYETIACLDTRARNKLIQNDEKDELFFLIENTCNQLGGLKKTLKEPRA